MAKPAHHSTVESQRIQDAVEAALREHGGHIADDLAKRVGIARSTVDRHLKALRELKRIRIGRYQRVGQKRTAAAVWVVGRGRNAEHPDYRAKLKRKPKLAPPPARNGIGTRFVGGINPWAAVPHGKGK